MRVEKRQISCGHGMSHNTAAAAGAGCFSSRAQCLKENSKSRRALLSLLATVNLFLLEAYDHARSPFNGFNG